MPSAIDTFRAQREAVEKVHAQLLEVSRLLNQLSNQATALTADKEFRAVLKEEQRWLAEASATSIAVTSERTGRNTPRRKSSINPVDQAANSTSKHPPSTEVST
jgi:hypothetical protein